MTHTFPYGRRRSPRRHTMCEYPFFFLERKRLFEQMRVVQRARLHERSAATPFFSFIHIHINIACVYFCVYTNAYRASRPILNYDFFFVQLHTYYDPCGLRVIIINKNKKKTK